MSTFLTLLCLIVLLICLPIAYAYGNRRGVLKERQTWLDRSKSVVCGETVFARGLGDVEITGRGEEDDSNPQDLIFFVKVADLEAAGFHSFGDADEDWQQKHEISVPEKDFVSRVEFVRAAKS